MVRSGQWRNILCLVLGICMVSHVISRPLAPGTNKLIYILLDGFRYDYVARQRPEDLPGFTRVLKNGVQAEYMSPIYPSVSYPDWTTLVTGLWAESHGIVGNFIYDPEDGSSFMLDDDERTGEKKWWTAEPIWITATKAEVKTAVILWSRCDLSFDGVTPAYCEHYVKIRGAHVFRSSVEKALDKLEQGYDFIQVYNEHIDDVGHDFGPDSQEIQKAIQDIDATIVYMLDRIEEMGMTDRVNIIIVSDHGMTNTAPGVVQRVQLDDYLLADYVESVADAGAFSNIKVKEGHVDQVYEKLENMPGVEVYKHEEIPAELHYKNNRYIHDIILKANIGTFMLKSRSPVQMPERADFYTYMGAHGYDRLEQDMQGIFFTSGPDFKNGSVVIPPIQNVDVYPLLTKLLQVDPRPHNGTMDVIGKALRQDKFCATGGS